MAQEIPDYKGFAWDHPLMVHWRKMHPVNPGLPKVFGGLSLLTCYGMLAVFGILFSVVFASESIGVFSTWYVVMVALIAAWFLAETRIFRQLYRWSGEKELDELLRQVEKLLVVAGREESCLYLKVNWADFQKRARDILVTLARTIIIQQRDKRDPLQSEAGAYRAQFRTTYDVFEKVGLIEGGLNGYKPYFDAAERWIKRDKDAEYPPSGLSMAPADFLDLARDPLDPKR